MSMRAAVVLPAAGSGRRMGGAFKPLLELDGEPLLRHALRPFLTFDEIEQVVIAVPPELLQAPPAWLASVDDRVTLVAGGAERGDSVRHALAVLHETIDVVLVHDAARPLISTALIARLLRAAGDGRSVIAALPVTDTIQVVDERGRIVATPDRERLRAAQTPQVFPRAVLVDAYARAAAEGTAGTDDAALVARCGMEVDVIDGEADNIKVTTRADLEIASLLLRRRAATAGTSPSDRDAEVVAFRTAADVEASLPRVLDHLRAGGVIVYPTETVYGFGCALRTPGLERLAALKRRTGGKPFLLLVAVPDHAGPLVWTDAGRRLAAAFWPGPLTIALTTERGTFPDQVRASDGTVAVRATSHPGVRRLLQAFAEPITSSSANAPGEPAANDAMTAARAYARLGGRDALVLDGGPLPPSAPSTVIDASVAPPRVVRVGAIGMEELRTAIGEVDAG